MAQPGAGAGRRRVPRDRARSARLRRVVEARRASSKYGILDIAGDVVGILDSLGVDRAHVVGHDWGAALAWAMAAFLPDRVDHLVALSVGHPSAFGAAGFDQRQKSWYMLLFQFEGIAEEWLSANDFANMRAWSHHPDIDQVVNRPCSSRCAHRGAQLVPRQRAPAHVDRAAAGLPADPGADDGRVEHAATSHSTSGA